MPLSVCSLQLHVLFNKFILETRPFLWLYKYSVQEFFTNFNGSKRFDIKIYFDPFPRSERKLYAKAHF